MENSDLLKEIDGVLKLREGGEKFMEETEAMEGIESFKETEPERLEETKKVDHGNFSKNVDVAGTSKISIDIQDLSQSGIIKLEDEKYKALPEHLRKKIMFHNKKMRALYKENGRKQNGGHRRNQNRNNQQRRSGDKKVFIVNGSNNVFNL